MSISWAENHITLSTDAENVFGKMQVPSMIGFSANVGSRIIASFGNNSYETPQQVS